MRRDDLDGLAAAHRPAGAERHREIGVRADEFFEPESSLARSALPGANCSGGSLWGQEPS